MTGVAQRDLAFLHGFQQSTLDLGGSPVDLIREHKIGKDGSFANNKLMLLLVVDHCTDDVCRKQIGGKLDAAEIGMNGLSQRFDSQCLSKSGYTLQEDVAVTEQSNEQTIKNL